jgi:tripeptide aminopeptidase
MNDRRLLERFLRYLQIDTTAGEPGGTYPSSRGQLELGRLLAAELRGLGLRDASHNEYGIVLATLPATVDCVVPTIAWFAHVDTSPDTTGKNVRPQVHADYDGGDLVLPGEQAQVLRVADNPDLKDLVGKTIITTDGTTLLGADDKAGVAAIVEAVAWLVEHPEIPHGPVRICFTCDEEIGHGVDHVDLQTLGAVVGYTLDGMATDEIDTETFSADLARICVRGVNIHPSIAKGRMVNAVRAAAALVDRLPRHELSPETTCDRQGFVHPYQVEGSVASVRLRLLLRDFETAGLSEKARLLRAAADAVVRDFPGVQIDVEIEPQYRNMADGLAREPRAVEFAEEALRRLGRTPRRTIIRGGTDGSRLTELGLPTPNLSTGEHNPHSPLEWTCLEEISQAAAGLVALSQVWAERGGDAMIVV